ncbi:MAG: N-acetylmuramoyl-L-alanine amidase [Clostridia bacterium]|nr:N-acetylmuramoyl-L-alanine amidase [Clostridia bacterium]MBR5366127.1 N-acetylmuramoyl-L-alanine amidase [Clostridia bacterium]
MRSSSTIRLLTQYSLIAVILASGCFFLGRAALERVSMPAVPAAADSDPSDAPKPLLVIDPGHGGEDGGASAGDVLEKDLNLAVSQRITDLCSLFGVPAAVTRTEDVLLYDYYRDLEDYRGNQKTYDLRNRLRFAEESGAAVFLSVHMNQFPQRSCRGMQVYYSPNTDASEELAARIRTSARLRLDPANERESKRATDAIYLLHRIRIPAVLVECGFLSNPDERALLTDPAYQQRIAAAVTVPVMEFLARRTEE